jgi:hypothetical protein
VGSEKTSGRPIKQKALPLQAVLISNEKILLTFSFPLPGMAGPAEANPQTDKE